MRLKQFTEAMNSCKISGEVNEFGVFRLITTDNHIRFVGDTLYTPFHLNGWIPIPVKYKIYEFHSNGLYSSYENCMVECDRLNNNKKAIEDQGLKFGHIFVGDMKHQKFTVPSHPVGTTPGAIDDYYTWYARMLKLINGIKENEATKTITIEGKASDLKSVSLKTIVYKIEPLGGKGSVTVTGDRISVEEGSATIWLKGCKVATIGASFVITEIK